MQIRQTPSQLPGVRVTTPFLVGAIVQVALVALWAVLIGLTTVVAMLSGGHLPWPVAQWALTTPAGLLVLLAVCVGVGAPTIIVVQRHILWRWTLLRAVDVTEIPPWIWLTRPPVYPGETRVDRWLGRGRRARMVSLTLLGVAALLVVSFLAAAVVSLGSLPYAACGVQGCPPMYPVLPVVAASEWVDIGLALFAQYLWLRRVEASAGVWLRYRNWFQTQGLCYIRQPGVTREAAAVTLARVARGAPPEALPLARVFALSVLATLPLFLLLIAGCFLQFWLATQWLPG